MKNFIKKNLIALLIWILGIPASVALSVDRYANYGYRFQIVNLFGYLILFFALGSIAHLLTANLEQKKKNNALKDIEEEKETVGKIDNSDKRE